MSESILALEHVSDAELVAEVKRLAESERLAIAKLVSVLGELDARRLYLSQGCSSMFTYCRQVLHLAEHAAFNRIEAARAARRFPVILAMLGDGRVHLSAVRLLAPHLTETNHQAVLNEASHQSKREIERIVAQLQPRPDAPPVVRKLPSKVAPAAVVSAVSSESALPVVDPAAKGISDPHSVGTLCVPRPTTEPLAPGRYKLQFTVGDATYQKLRRAQDLLRHCLRTGDPGEIFDRALTLLVADLENTSSRPPNAHARLVLGGRSHAMCRRRYGVRYGRGMAAAVDSKDRPADALKPGCWSFIT